MRAPAALSFAAVLLLTRSSSLAQQPTFEETRKEFQSRAASALGQDAVASWNTAAVFVSRETVSRFANTLVEGAHLSVHATLPQRVLDSPSSEVRTPKIAELNCSHDRWGCNSDCGWDLGCAIAKGVCEANKATQVGICEAQKVANQAISDKKIFTVSTHAVNVSADASAQLHASLDPSLSHVSVSMTDLNGTFHLLGGSATFSPELLVGILTACAPFTVTIPGTDLSIDQTSATATAGIQLSQTGDTFDLKVNASTPSIDFHFNQNPILNVIKSNLHALVLCPVATTLVFSAGAAFDLGWNDKVALPAGGAAFSIALGDLRIPVPGSVGTLVPVLDALSIGWQEAPQLAEVRP